MNNRQGGRRRGRGGPRPQGMAGNSGGARDNRQRGNAAQLLEKYKGLARDAQLAGDRVQTEYYLQFADHYFRVLSETRSRYEEQRRNRDDFDDDEDLDDEVMEADAEERTEQRQPQREPRGRSRSDRGDNDGEGEPPRRERYAREDRGGERRERRERFNGGNRDDSGEEEAAEPRIAAELLPPAIGAIDGAPEPVNDVAEEDEAPRPRRRTRRPRIADGGEDIAPAA